MGSALQQAIELIASGNDTLFQIIGVTLRMSLTSSLVALLIGVPLGVLLTNCKTVFGKVIIVLNRTMMGLPPVVCGLLCYLMFCGVGPLRHMDLLYTVEGMIVAQIILITPLVAGNIESLARNMIETVQETARGLGMPRWKVALLVVSECRYQVFTTYILGLGRGLAEVGAVSMVGGAIAYKTNVMTTAIMMYTNQGDFKMAIALGIILIAMFLIMNIVVYCFQARVSR